MMSNYERKSISIIVWSLLLLGALIWLLCWLPFYTPGAPVIYGIVVGGLFIQGMRTWEVVTGKDITDI